MSGHRNHPLKPLRLLVTAALAACGLNPEAAPAADWPNWLGPHGDGVSRETGWKPELGEVAWRAKVGIGFSGVAVAGGRCYTLGHGGKGDGHESVYCFDAASGKELWVHRYPAGLVANLHEGGPSATPAVRGDDVFTLGKEGRLLCLDTASGEVRWERDMLDASGLRGVPEWGFTASPLVLGDTVIVEAAHTFALDRRTGETVWKSARFRPAYGSPSVLKHGAKTYLAVLKTEGLVVLDAAGGKTVAQVPWKTRFDTNSTTPLVIGHRIFVSTGYRQGCALFEFDGRGLTTVYTNKSLSNHMNNSVLVGGHLYGFDGNTHMAGPKELVCMELATGAVQWRLGDFRCGSLTAADGKLIVLGEKGELAIAPASPEGFQATDRMQVLGGRCWTAPVLANGRIYCRNARGDLVCLDQRGEDRSPPRR